MVGRSIPRVDGNDKVTGRAVYVDDLQPEGMWFGQTVRSKCAHGTLQKIDLGPGFDWSQVVVATAEDIPGRNTVLLIEDDQPALVPLGGTIRHPDEAVALIAAPSQQLALEALANITLVVDEKKPVFDLEEAVTAEVKIHQDNNIYKSFLIEKGDDVDAALAACDIVIEGEYRTPSQEQMYIEPQGMLSTFKDGHYHIVGSMQCPFYVHKAMIELLGVGGDDVVIEQAVTGGGFGGKEEYPSMIAGHCAILARKAGRPVKLIYDREEDIAATPKRHPAVIKHRLGLKKDGTFVACDVDVTMDGGAYLTLSPVVLSRGVLHAAGPYRFDSVRIRGRCVATNHPPHGAFRGFGAPQTTFAYERQVQKAARILGRDAFDLREQNCLRIGDLTATSQKLEASVGSLTVLREVKDVAGEIPEHGIAKKGDHWVRRGRGLAFYFHGAGFTGSGEQRLAGRATVAAVPGGRFEVRSSSTDIGQGTLTIFSQIASSVFEVDPSLVDIIGANTALVPDSGPTVASRTCMVVGAVVEQAANELKSKIEKYALENKISGSLEEKTHAMVENLGEQTATSQYKPPPGIQWDDDTYTGSAYPVYGWAACLVDVAVDCDTHEVEIERCIHAVDIGKAIHPIIVKGQIEGGTLQALGWGLLENVQYKEGRVLNRTMATCIVPTAPDAPEMETILVEEPYPFGPHGAKGVGEIPMDGPAVAIAGAVTDALGPDFDALPVSPESIFAALSSQRQSPNQTEVSQ